MLPNKFFNDSSTTSGGKAKWLPPQKRGVSETDPTPQEAQSQLQNQPQPPNQPYNQNYNNQGYSGFKRQDGNQGQNTRSNFGQPFNSYNRNQGYNPHQNFQSHHHHHQSHSVDPTEVPTYQNYSKSSFGRDDNQENKRFNSSFFDKSRSKTQSDWGYRHLRRGYVEKDVEAEEKALFEAAKSSNPLQVENVKNYDHLKVDIINKFKLPMPQIHDDFKSLSLAQPLLDNIDRCGYQNLTIIQRHSIPNMLAGLNLMASSQTGSGKTASFLLPIIQSMLKSGPPKGDVSKEEYKRSRKCYPIAIIMAPTRELAIQIHEEAKKFCHLTGILAKVIYGGKDSYNQQRNLSWDGCDILVTTPGRLIDFMDRIVDFSFVRFVVLDEADRMLDMGFEPQIRQIMDKTFASNVDGDNILVAMFSATFPKEVRGLAENYLQKYIYIGIGSEGKTGTVSQTIKQELVDVRHRLKNQVLFEHVKNLEGKILIFCATKKAVSNVHAYLSAKNLFVAQIHGDLVQKDREAELGLFKNKCSVLIATDVASRGLDIPDVAYVVNYDLPTNIESYIHRIGRTGRIGKTGTSISFVSDFDEPMYNKLYGVLKDSNQQIPDWFQELIHSKYQREERQPPQNRSGKPYHHKWRGGYKGGQGRNDFYGGGGGRGGYNRNDDDQGYDSDYSRPQTTSYGNRGGGGYGGGGGGGGYNQSYGYE